MFGFRKDREEKRTLLPRSTASWPTMPGLIEALEDRRLLSASVVNHAAHTHAVHHAATHVKLTARQKAAEAADASSSSSSSLTASTDGSTIEFSQAPTAVQTGLTTLASTDGLTAPTATQTVYLGNQDGIESYTLDYSTTGTTTRITVDQNGNAVTAQTTSTTTWATLSGTGSGSESAAAAEITAIARALGVTAPTDTTTVDVSTTAAGVSTYTVKLANSSTSTSTSSYGNQDQTVISVDSSGNPVGSQKIPFSTLPSAIQSAINSDVPTGDTALDSTSTQTVNVRTENGVTTYSVTFGSTGTQTVVTVNAAGTLTNLPSQTTEDFSAIPSAAQTELQSLATADGYTGTISTTQSVTAYDEGNGTVIYTVHLTSSSTDSSGTAITLTLTLSVDQDGNPTVPPGRGGGMGGGCAGDMGGGFGDGRPGDFDGAGSSSLTSSSTTSTE